jgi:hypothetical protein
VTKSSPPFDPISKRRDHEVDHELGRQRADQNGRTGIGRVGARQREHCHWADRKPRVAEIPEQPARPMAAGEHLRQAHDHERRHDCDRDDRDRHREQQWDEAQLRSGGEPERGSELHPRRRHHHHQAERGREQRERVRRVGRPEHAHGREEPDP